MAFIKPAPARRTASGVSADRMNKYRPSAAGLGTIKPKAPALPEETTAGWSTSVFARVWPGFHQGDDENINPSRSSAGRTVSKFVLKGRSNRSPTGKPGEKKGQLTSTATRRHSRRRWYERAVVSPKDSASRSFMARSTSTGGLHCQHGPVRSRLPQNGPCCCTFTRAMHAVIDRPPQARHPLSGVVWQGLRLSGAWTSCTPAPWWAS